MKKYIYWIIIVIAIIFVVIFRQEIANELGKLEVVQNLSARIVGMQPANKNVPESGSGYYAYETLSEEEKLVYNQMADCLLNHKTEVTISTKDEKKADQAFRCLLNDRPEIFWVDSYEMTAYNVSGISSQYSFQPVYNMSKEDVEKNQAVIDTSVEECLAGIPSDADEYTKIKYLYDYIVLNTAYNKNAENDQNICSVFINKESVCAGYAKAFQYLLQKCGIESVLVLGHSFDEAHAWNLVKLENEYYYFDVTWGDPQFGSAAQAKSWYVDYGFFGLTTEDLLKNHTIENAFELPECVADSYNYYKREGLYLEAFSEDAVVQIVQKQLSERQFATIRCSNEEVYKALHEYLIINGHIWKLATDNEISYSEDDQYHILTIFKE